MKFNNTPSTCLTSLNPPFLLPFSSYNLSEIRLTFKLLSAFKKPFVLKLTPWLKQINKTSILKIIKIKQTFKLFKTFNFFQKRGHRYSLLSSFIRSNLSIKLISLNYLQLSPLVYKTIVFFNNLLFSHIQKFNLYQNYLFTYLQLISTINLVIPSFFHKPTNLLYYKNLFNQNLKTL